GIEATKPLLERLDQLVAVRGLVLELLQDDVLQIAALEHLPPKLVEPEFTMGPHRTFSASFERLSRYIAILPVRSANCQASVQEAAGAVESPAAACPSSPPRPPPRHRRSRRP